MKFSIFFTAKKSLYNLHGKVFIMRLTGQGFEPHWHKVTCVLVQGKYWLILGKHWPSGDDLKIVDLEVRPQYKQKIATDEI